MTAMVWWLIPLLSCLAAYVWTRTGLARSQPTPPAPGSPEDAADLARFAAALRQPLPEPGAQAPREQHVR